MSASTGVVDARLAIALDMLAAFIGRTMDHEIVDDLVGNRLDGGLAIPGFPERPELRERVSAAEPFVIGRVDGNREIGGGGPPTDRPGEAPIRRRDHEDPRHDLLARSSPGPLE